MSSSLKKNAIFNTIKTCSSLAFPLIVFPYVLRVLQPTNVGKVNFGQSVVSYFTLLSTLGMSTYAIRECAKVKEDKKKLTELASQLYSINLYTTIIAYVLLTITLLAFRKFDDYRILIIILSSTILFTSLGADWLNSAMEDFKYITIRTVAFQIVSILLIFVFVQEPEDYIRYACITVLSSSGGNVVNIRYRRRYCTLKITTKMNIKKHIIPILAFFAMLLSSTIFANADTTMLGLMTNDYEVGIYGTAHKISHLVSQLVQSIIVVLIPKLSVLFSKGDFTSINKLLRKLLVFNISLGLPCVIGVIMIAKDAVFVFAGADYLASANVLKIMILSFAFSLVGGSFIGSGIMLPMGKEKYYMIVCLITAACNIILNYFFIPIYQSQAAAATTAFNGLLIFLLLLFKVDKRIKIERLASVFISPVLGGVGIIGVCLLCQNIEHIVIRLLVSLSASALVYGIILYMMKNEMVMEIIGIVKNAYWKLKER